MKRSSIAVSLCAVIAVVLLSQPILAQKAFLEKFKATYPGVEAKCTMCHDLEGKEKKPNKKNLNAYGSDLQNAPEAKEAMGKDGKHKYTDAELTAVAAGIVAIGKKDSNGNGKSNEDEIKAGGMPGKK